MFEGHFAKIAVLAVGASLAISNCAHGADIWFAAVDPVARNGGPASIDYMDLFEPNAPWQRAAASVKVFKIGPAFAAWARTEVLAHVFSDLRRRGIALAWELPMLNWSDRCGHVEGFNAPGTIAKAAQHLREAGADVAYIAMDEPLYYGHQYSGASACRFSASDVAQQIAESAAVVRTWFPRVQIGDIEPVDADVSWAGQLEQWPAEFRAALGAPLAFFHADMVWSAGARASLVAIAHNLSAHKIRIGVIYNGSESGEGNPNLEWVRSAERHYDQIETETGLQPDDAVFQTWMPYPTHVLPETSPGTMTYLIDRYLARPTKLGLARSSEGLIGKLTDSADRPITGAKVDIFAVANARVAIMNLRKISGTVPEGASAATLAVRINAECNCSGQADVSIGPITYRDEMSGQTLQRHFEPVTGQTGVTPRFTAEPGQKVWQNTLDFPVLQKDPYTVEIPISATHDSSNSGVVAIIFLDRNGKGISRRVLPFQESTERIGTAVTDLSGNIIMRVPSAVGDASFRGKFLGTVAYRYGTKFLP